MSRLKMPACGRSRASARWLHSRSQGICPDGAVFLHAPSFAFQAAGGGENQLVQTGRHLEALGLSVRLFSPWTDRLDRGRLLHLFGMSREGLELARCARARGTVVVISPISWFEPGALWSLEKSLARKLGGLAAWSLRRLVPRFPGWKRELLHLADRVLPNSRAEARQLESLFGVDPAKMSVIPNGVLASFRAASPAAFRERFGDEEFVLFVGRIEPRKNPLGLIQALRSLGLRLVVIGEAPPERAGYLEQCRAAGGDRVLWLPARDHGDPLLASAYSAARVFALPSWFETPGLAALEAALAGTAIVVTPHGSTREYFGHCVRYARPDRVGEIAFAIRQAWDHGPDPRLADFIASHYLWPRVARKTAEVYDEVA